MKDSILKRSAHQRLSKGLVRVSARNHTSADVRIRKYQIGGGLLRVIEKAAHLKKSTTPMKFPISRSNPPMTTAFKQCLALKEVNRYQEILKHEMVTCDEDDINRAQKLASVAEKCESLKDALAESETMVRNHQKQMKAHRQFTESCSEEIQASSLEIKHYLLAASKLEEIRAIMKSVSVQNYTYFEFLEEIARQSGNYSSAHEITGRYEELVNMKEELTKRLDETLRKLDDAKRTIMTKSAKGNVQHKMLLHRLAAIDYELNMVKTNTLKYELALNRIHCDTHESKKEAALILRSAQEMVDRLIKDGVINKKYRCTTLAKQLEAVRESYLRKKAIIRKFNRAIETKSIKENLRSKVFESYEQNLKEDSKVKELLLDMKMKKKSAALKKAEVRYSRKMRRMKSRTYSMFFVDSDKSSFDDFVPAIVSRVGRKVGSVNSASDVGEDEEDDAHIGEMMEFYRDDTTSQSSRLSAFGPLDISELSVPMTKASSNISLIKPSSESIRRVKL